MLRNKPLSLVHHCSGDLLNYMVRGGNSSNKESMAAVSQYVVTVFHCGASELVADCALRVIDHRDAAIESSSAKFTFSCTRLCSY